MKHKLKRIFNRRFFSRALITVITCSIIFSYAVLCPQVESPFSLSAFAKDHIVFFDISTSELYISDSSTWIDPHFTSSTSVEGFGSRLSSDDIGFVPDGYFCYTLDSSLSYVTYDTCSFDTIIPHDSIPSVYNTVRIEYTIVKPFYIGAEVLPNGSFIIVSDSDFNTELYFDRLDLTFEDNVFIEQVTGIQYKLSRAVSFVDLTDLNLNDFYYVSLYNKFMGSCPSSGSTLVYCPYTNLKYTFYEETFEDVVSIKLDEISTSLENTNSTLVSIENTLTNVTPEMQESINNLETLIQDEQEKIDDVITEMGNIGTDFGTEIGDFDNILNENAGTLEDIGSTTYNSFINDVFGNWFFVSMFALFGAFAFFSRAVFG